MVKKLQETDTDKTSASQFSGAVKDSAQRIWLAGLGAFAKAQEEGGKVFETLVNDGLSIQRKTQAVAEDRMTEASQRMTSLANDIQSKAGNQWGKLENIFEERVAKAMEKLGAPSAKTIEALLTRIEALERSMATNASSASRGSSLAPKRKAPANTPMPATGKAASKSAIKTTPAKKAKVSATKHTTPRKST